MDRWVVLLEIVEAVGGLTVLLFMGIRCSLTRIKIFTGLLESFISDLKKIMFSVAGES